MVINGIYHFEDFCMHAFHRHYLSDNSKSIRRMNSCYLSFFVTLFYARNFSCEITSRRDLRSIARARVVPILDVGPIIQSPLSADDLFDDLLPVWHPTLVVKVTSDCNLVGGYLRITFSFLFVKQTTSAENGELRTWYHDDLHFSFANDVRIFQVLSYR